jgi:acyl-CoA dehydrogenase
MDALLTDSFARLLEAHCGPGQLRRFEAGASTVPLWNELQASGYADALLAETAGGAGLSLSDICDTVIMSGRYLAPVPIAETMVARALLADSANTFPPKSIVLVTPVLTNEGLFQAAVPFAQTDGLALIEIENQLLLVGLAEAEVTATGVRGSLAADVLWRQPLQPILATDLPTASLREIGATIRAAQMAGAMARLLEISVNYVNTREQFGRPLAKFQALQQQLAVMAELVLGANMAVQLAYHETGVVPVPLLAALAKQRTSEAACRVSAIAHAVHGAIGLSDEYDLQLYVRRLYEWRLADGSEAYWCQRIGESRLACTSSSLDFIREHLSPLKMCS